MLRLHFFLLRSKGRLRTGGHKDNSVSFLFHNGRVLLRVLSNLCNHGYHGNFLVSEADLPSSEDIHLPGPLSISSFPTADGQDLFLRGSSRVGQWS